MARQKYVISIANMIIPVKLKKLSDEKDINFKELHAKAECGKRLGRKVICVGCVEKRAVDISNLLEKMNSLETKLGKKMVKAIPEDVLASVQNLLVGSFAEVPKEEKGKGWVETDKQEFPLQFTKEELALLHPMDVPEATIQVRNFIDPLPLKWYKGSHYVVTPQDNNVTYTAVLAHMLSGIEKSGKVALVKYWDSNTEYNAVLNGNGVLSHIFYNDEVDNENIYLAPCKSVALDADIIELVTSTIAKNTQPFNPETLVNNYRILVTEKALEKKEKGNFTVTEQSVAPEVKKAVDLKAFFGVLKTAEAKAA